MGATLGFGIPLSQAASEFELSDTDGSGAINGEEHRARLLVIFAHLDVNVDG